MKRVIAFLCGILLVSSTILAQNSSTVSIDQRDVTMNVGDVTTITCTVTGKYVPQWHSNNESVVTLKESTDGKSATLTAVGVGVSYVSVTLGSGLAGGSDYISVTVKEKEIDEKDFTFVPTTISGGKFASDTHWYLITLRGDNYSGKYMHAESDELHCTLGTPYYDGKSPMTHYLWAITGDYTNGYRFYNYDTGASKVVGVLPLSINEYSAYEGAPAMLYDTSEIDEKGSTFRLSTYGTGYVFTLSDEYYAGLNDYNGAGIVKVWDHYLNLYDSGAAFHFYEVDPVDYGAIPTGGTVKETQVTLNTTTLNLQPNGTSTLVATVLPDNATYKRVTWSTSNSNVAVVNADGVVTARGVGSATITATTHSGLTASAEVHVTNDINVDGLVINEVQAANVDQYLDPSYNYGGWIELYNGSNKSIDVSSLFLTDDASNPAQWALSSLNGTYADFQKNNTRYEPHERLTSVVPAKGYITVWFDHNDWRYPMMCPFKLDCDGGSIYVTDGANILTQCDYPESISRASWARTTDGGNTWGWTSEPTPKASNLTSKFATERLAAPSVNEDSQLFSGTLNVQVTWPSDATLRYTLDGSTPTATNGSTSASGIFPLTATTILRLCAVQDGKISSPVVTRSYIVSKFNETLPVVSLVTEPGNLYDSMYGIMTRGSNGRPGLSSYSTYASPSNWNQDWDRPANIELIGKDGRMLFNQEANIAICGGWSRAYEPYSFKVKGKKQYEHMNYLPYQFFSAKPYIKNKTLQMRNGGNDNPGNGGTGRIFDAAIQTAILSSGLNVDGQSYEPVHLYRNGTFIGIINMREPNNKDLVYSNYGYDEEEVDQFEMDCDSLYVQSSGDREAFERWVQLAQDSADPEAYEELKKICDVEAFINYMALQCYLNLSDYGYNNVKGFRPRVENGKFRMVLYDLDSASKSTSGCNFGLASTTATATSNQRFEDTNGGKGGGRVSGPLEFRQIFGHLLKNSDEFRKQFVDQFSIICGSVLEPSRCHAIVDSLLNNVLDAAKAESSLYPSTVCSQVKNYVFNSKRIDNAMAMMADNSYYSAACRGNNQRLVLTQNNYDGRVLYNDLTIPTGKFSGRIFSPVTLRAEAPAGYKFVGWKNLSGTPTVEPETGKEEKIFDFGSKWLYYDQGSLDEEAWTNSKYNGDLSWPEGPAPLGYNTRNGSEFNTTLNYGGVASAKYPTYYFRKSFNLTSIPQSIKLYCHIDDGAAVYLNGKEIVRHNLPEGAKYDDYAFEYTNNAYYNQEYNLNVSDFVEGTNVLAVEVHNNVPGSSDIYWDAALTYVPKADKSDPETQQKEENIVSTDAEYTLPTSGNFQLEAIYAPLTQDELLRTDNHPVKINEVSAANSIYVNDYFKKDDWVELYNTTSEDIDLTGYYLSDNHQKPQKYQIGESAIKGGNVIPAHGHRVIWCSKRERKGTDIHASFKLDNEEGSYVVLTSPDQSWADTLTYSTMNGDETCGLYPDGSSYTYMLQIPTIDKTNMKTMYAGYYDEHALEKENSAVGVKYVSQSNELGINYRSGALYVTNEDFLTTTVEVYNAAGQIVMSREVAMPEGTAAVDVSHLPVGVYVARATDSEDEHVSVKFMVK